MARNQEKAQTMLARWLRFREGEYDTSAKRRPYLAEQCDNLHSAEKWRAQIIKEIGAKVTEIQNASLGEHRIRDLNDEINKLFREKYHWQRRILQLGGVDYNKREFRNRDFSKMTLATGGPNGYMYFGAARELPGVRELLQVKIEQDELRRKGKLYLSKDRVTGKGQRSRRDFYEMINGIDYYGFRDDDDGILRKYEKLQEMKARKAKIDAWNKKNNKNNNNNRQRKDDKTKDNNENDVEMNGMNEKEEESKLFESEMERRPWQKQEKEQMKMKKKKKTRISSMRVPSQSEIDAIILQKRKEMLLNKYAKGTAESKQLATQLKMDDKIKQTRKMTIENNNNNSSNNDNNNRQEDEDEDIDIETTGNSK